MVIGKNQLILGGVLLVAIVAALVVFHRGEATPTGTSARASEVERAIRDELRGKQICGYCMEPEVSLHKIGDITLKDLGSNVFKAEIAVECKAAENGKARVKVLTREYAVIEGVATCTMPNLGWRTPESK